ncbi:MAG: Ig-like domain-containing protein, partial [Acidobacteriota bacterium]
VITAEGAHTLAVSAIDAASHASSASVSFTIDKTVPALAITSPKAGDVVADPQVVVSGSATDVTSISVNGVVATIDATAKTFTAIVPVAEGSNNIVATGRDGFGGTLTTSVAVSLDTRAPQLAIATPAQGACLNATSLELRGTVSDPHLKNVTVQSGSTSVDAGVDAATGTWVATLPNASEGKSVLTAAASDTLGHTATASLTLNVDRTAPVLEVTSGGAPFTSVLVNHPVTLNVSARDTDPSPSLSSTLDGVAYTSGAAITGEGLHKLDVAATDCAGLQATRHLEFTLDRTAPVLTGFVPADGSTVGTAPAAIHALTNEPATIQAASGGAPVTVDPAGAFDLSGLTFVEGLNTFTLHAIDKAGNAVDIPYAFTLRTTRPAVEILDNGSPIADGSLFNRAVAPVLRANVADLDLAATLNNERFTSGTTLAVDGAFALTATATDPLGNVSTNAVRFTIDRTAPQVSIATPRDSEVIDADQVTVTGNAGDSIALTLNGLDVPLVAGGAFSAPATLEAGENVILAVGRDRAGNSGSARIVVTRAGAGTGIILTSPASPVTNRRTVVVSGRILTPANAATLTVEARTGSQSSAPLSVPFDQSGAFAIPDFALLEGTNTITARLTAKNSQVTTATATILVDLTAPSLRILAGGAPLDDGARFPASTTLSLDASDLPAGNAAPLTELRVDGVVVTAPFLLSATGAHTAVATATDAAGNQARVRRSFLIGAQGAAGCALGAFDPPNGSVVTASSTTVNGTSGGAAGVKLNGVPARVAGSSFAGTVELSQEGPNVVTIACTDGAGVVLGATATLTLVRATNAPSVLITTPAEMFVSGTPSVAVSGTVGPGVTAVDVNGSAATLTASTFTAPAVPLSSGLNTLVAHARNAAGRMATASRRVLYLKNAPLLSITWPLDGYATGGAAADISGTWSNLEPATITAGSGTAAPHTDSDTAGSFVIRGVSLLSGPQAVTLSARDALGRATTAVVNITRGVTGPAIAITSPADNSYASTATVAVSGNVVAADGSQVDVGGAAATLAGTSFTGAAALSSSGATPVVSRATQPDGNSAIATVFVTRLAAPPNVREAFPAAEAVSVDGGVIALVSFTAPMDRASLTDAFVLLDGSNAPVTGQLRLDRDVLSFAPAAVLNPGQRYTLVVRTSARDLAGTALASEFRSSFTVATTAPADAPVVDAITSPVCATQLTITGTSAPGARVELALGGVPQFATADATGHFTATLVIPSQSAFRTLRVRTLGGDGSYSPVREAGFQVDCSGTTVSSATYDRAANAITIVFSRPIDPSSATVGATGSIRLRLTDGTAVSGSVLATAPNTLVVTPGTPDPRAATLLLTVTTTIKDATGQPLPADATFTFTIGGDDAPPNDGSGYVSGQILDATTGRPLSGATVTTGLPSEASRRGPVASLSLSPRSGSSIERPSPPTGEKSLPRASEASRGVPKADEGASSGEPKRIAALSQPNNSVTTPLSGRYTIALPEGAYTLHASAPGHTDVWRQVVVPAGVGVIPLDIRLTTRGTSAAAGAGELRLSNGGDTTVTRRATLVVPATVLPAGTSLSLTSLGAQSLSGLLPLGWSPLAAAEVRVAGGTPGAATSQLTFDVPATDLTASGRTLTAVSYDAARDEWRVLQPVVAISGNNATLDVVLPPALATFALVYGDNAAGLQAPAAPVAGGALTGVASPCASSPCALVSKSFVLNPSVVLPDGRSVATLVMEGAAPFPSGTAVQAYVNEELRLVDGSVQADELPFSADLILYRSLSGTTASADFHLKPAAKAATVPLQVGFDHVQVFPYPGRLDRGTLAGAAGGAIPGDERVQLELPPGATADALHAAA